MSEAIYRQYLVDAQREEMTLFYILRFTEEQRLVQSFYEVDENEDEGISQYSNSAKFDASGFDNNIYSIYNSVPESHWQLEEIIWELIKQESNHRTEVEIQASQEWKHITIMSRQKKDAALNAQKRKIEEIQASWFRHLVSSEESDRSLLFTESLELYDCLQQDLKTGIELIRKSQEDLEMPVIPNLDGLSKKDRKKAMKIHRGKEMEVKSILSVRERQRDGAASPRLGVMFFSPPVSPTSFDSFPSSPLITPEMHKKMEEAGKQEAESEESVPAVEHKIQSTKAAAPPPQESRKPSVLPLQPEELLESDDDSGPVDSTNSFKRTMSSFYKMHRPPSLTNIPGIIKVNSVMMEVISHPSVIRAKSGPIQNELSGSSVAVASSGSGRDVLKLARVSNSTPEVFPYTPPPAPEVSPTITTENSTPEVVKPSSPSAFRSSLSKQQRKALVMQSISKQEEENNASPAPETTTTQPTPTTTSPNPEKSERKSPEENASNYDMSNPESPLSDSVMVPVLEPNKSARNLLNLSRTTSTKIIEELGSSIGSILDELEMSDDSNDDHSK
eukprot:NODE_1465_length_1943_cov_4.608791_g1243_i0.p1 GENE.NODE_1465_length_1943_cov_4.608791_g1243_i0~~NODE_1465_length_1943_cov_4.608791_g1243_i0.p1  ORF type:complete len:625 (-),score=156.03 NODE_1465_length_1943_cov_4.608791_g1243_i0:67-1746(-)